MRTIEQTEICQGQYYLAYIPTSLKGVILCYSKIGGYLHGTLLDIDTSKKEEYSFGSAWELFELNEAEIIKQLVMEKI